MNRQYAEADFKFSQTWRALLAVSVLIAMAACSSDEPVTDAIEHGKDPNSEHTAHPSPALPDFFPDQIPLPDAYMIVRDGTVTSKLAGREIALNIALPGSIEEWRQTYDAALRAEFKGVEFEAHADSLRWRFHGQGFDHAILYLNDNQGYLDRGSTDSTHLPVMLSLRLTERRIR